MEIRIALLVILPVLAGAFLVIRYLVLPFMRRVERVCDDYDRSKEAEELRNRLHEQERQRAQTELENELGPVPETQTPHTHEN